MWISGYRLDRHIHPPPVLASKIQLLVQELAEEISCPFKASAHSEACYLIINGIEVSFRNHRGRGYDIGIYLADYRTWEDCKHHFLHNILPQIQSPVNISDIYLRKDNHKELSL